MTVVLADLKADCGEVYDNLNNGTTAATSLLSKATATIVQITGSATAYDLAIRNLADAFIVQQVIGSSESTDVAISSIRIGRKELVNMRDNFFDETETVLARDGFTLKAVNIGFKVVNQ